ncbi:emp24/gp25L/p24 family/GOLD-domain-containing protein [Tricharina praecox]|uniref:emp24/gp25L/p24 family/GOLD-domain-containing protein n=1 Tax=Tricharina praecox TaxID=43433 RepID=UPI00222062B4|nr:emp24/gp25L/p24 family/GOLD-domain-containing protein [Tricharina praecox]KAI5844118.1 emp24/gp25L/p24 family/GOLD-domain-containing protein [Tricharina praecox]
MQLRLSTLVLAASLVVKQASALYFYIDGTSPKCFFEDLPKDTLVVGQYKAEEWSQQTNTYSDNNQLALLITVDETFDNDHRVVNQKGSNKGRFTFTASSAGEHRICFWASHQSNSGWFSSHPNGVRLHLDLAIGETTQLESRDKEKLADIEQRVKDLSGRLQDIRREQVFQREREAEFRDQSELTNSRVVRWTLVQLLVLGATCAWQLSHLRAFFIKQKLT